jgi:hypothetical protein
MIKQHAYLLLSCLTVTIGCSNNSNNDKSAIPAPAAAQALRVMAPFRYHKTIEVSPGQYYDVLAWGRGSETVGAFQILRSDSATMKYTTTTGDLEGNIVDVFNADMDTDGNPELFIHTQAADSTNAAQVFAFEYNDDNARKLDFPRLTRSQRKGYRGNDHFYIKEDHLMREFEVYNEDDSLAKKPIQKRIIEYSLRGNSLSSHQITTDSAPAGNSGSAAPLVAAGAAAATANRSETKSSSVSQRSSRRRSSVKKRQTSRKKESKRNRRRHR